MVNRAYKKSLTLLFHSEINVERKLIKRDYSLVPVQVHSQVLSLCLSVIYFWKSAHKVNSSEILSLI